MSSPQTPGGLSRRTLLRSALVGAAGFSTLGLSRAAMAQNSVASPVGRPIEIGPTQILDTTTPATAVGGGTNGNLAAVNAALQGTGLYIGNEGKGWTDSQWQSAFAKIRGWGFNFVCPKVGGYGSTYYVSDAQLAHWRDLAHGVNLGYAPFIYTVPTSQSYLTDAKICSDIGNICGIAVVDMEDEWGATSTANYNTQMTAFGNTYRALSPDTPIIVTGYGDPTTRFGASGWPFAQMSAWADAYSPQWYYGEWTIYHTSGVKAAINWGASQCDTVFGSSYPLCPSVEIYSGYSASGILPAADLTTGETYVKNWKAPIFWWEYSDMTAAIAASIVPPGPQNVTAGVGQTWQTAFYNPVLRQITQTVTLTNTSASPISGPMQVQVTGLPSGVSLANASGSYNGSPYLTASASALAPGDSLSVLLRLRAPSTARFTYGAQIFSGSF